MSDPNANYEPLGKRAFGNQHGTGYQQTKFDLKRLIRFVVLLCLLVIAAGLAIEAPSSLIITAPIAALIYLANRYTKRSTTPPLR